MKRFILTTVIPVLFAAGIAVAYYEFKSHKDLDACARVNNVYNCHWIAVPVQGPEVIEVPAEILPPPVE